MNAKLKNATKKIVAVATSAAVVSSTVFASGLANYPSNFVEDDKFMGQVVIGSEADSAAAVSIINDLKAQFSGEEEMVKVSYQKTESADGETVKFAESGESWNFGEANSDVRTSMFDEADSESILSDELTFDNGLSDEDYSQELSFDDNAVKFEHTLRDEHSDEISTHLFVDNGDNGYISKYVLELDNALVGADAAGDSGNFVGETLEVLGNEYTITEVGFDTTLGIDKLGLIGGANKISLGESEETTVSVDGKDYTVSIQSVSNNEVLLTVNGESNSIDEYDTEQLGGITIAVTDLVDSSRDSVKGYAEIVIGGNEILLENGQEVKVNDEEISDVYEDYKVVSTFTNSGTNDEWTGFELAYSTDDTDGILLTAGDSWEDKVFNKFSLAFDGTNDVDYSEVELTASSDKLSLTGTTESEDSFSEDIAHAVDDAASNPSVRLIGGDEDTPMLLADITFGANVNVASGVTDGAVAVADTSGVTGTTEHVVYEELGGTAGQYDVANDRVIYAGTADEIAALFNLTAANSNVDGILMTEADAGMRFVAGDVDGQYLYEIASYDSADDETSVDEVYSGDSVTTDKDNLDVASKLDDVTTFTITTDVFTVLDADYDLTFNGNLAFEDEFMVDLSGVSSITADTSTISFDYDEDDLDVDDSGDASGFSVTMSWDNDDDEFVIGSPDNGAVIDFGSGTEQDTEDGNDNVQEFVTKYGTKLVYDNDEGSYVKVHTPEEQVEAEVSLVFGEAGNTESGSRTVSADEVEAVKEELEADGYTITGTETMTSEEVEFMVEGAVMDSEADLAAGNHIVVGGPAVNAAARAYLGIEEYTMEQAGVAMNEYVIKYFEEANSVLVYGYSAADTAAAAAKLNAGGLSGEEVRNN